MSLPLYLAQKVKPAYQNVVPTTHPALQIKKWMGSKWGPLVIVPVYLNLRGIVIE